MIDLAIVLAFVAYSVTAGLRARRRASRGLDEYFLAGRSLRGWRAGLSMAATQYAADTPLLVAGLVAAAGIFSLWRLWIYGLAFLLMGYLLGHCWRRARVLTDAELVELRYSGPGVLWLRGLKALYYGTAINCVVMAFVLVAAMRIFEVFLPWQAWLPPELYEPLHTAIAATGLDLASGALPLPVTVATTNNIISLVLLLAFVALYSTTGGLRGVVATDVAQFALMLLGTAVYALFALRAAGGREGMLDALRQQYGSAQAETFLSFAPPLDEALLPFLAVLGLQWAFQVNSDGTGYLAQRMMACASDREAQRAATVFAFAQVVLRSLLWLPIVVALLVIFPLSAAGTLSEAELATREMTFVLGIDQLLPAGARGLMLTALLAALASTLDTHLNWGASYWSNDLYKGLWVERVRRREAGRRELLIVARLSTLGVLAIALLIMVNLGSIQRAWQLSLLFGAGIGAVLLLRWLWERVNVQCEIAAIVVSLLAAPLLLVFVEEEWRRLALMAAASTCAILLTAVLTRPTDAAVLLAFYQKVSPPGWWPSSARLAGESPRAPLARWWHGAAIVLSAALCLFSLLTGLGIWLLRPGEHWVTAAALTLSGAAALLWRRVARQPA